MRDAPHAQYGTTATLFMHVPMFEGALLRYRCMYHLSRSSDVVKEFMSCIEGLYTISTWYNIYKKVRHVVIVCGWPYILPEAASLMCVLPILPVRMWQAQRNVKVLAPTPSWP